MMKQEQKDENQIIKFLCFLLLLPLFFLESTSAQELYPPKLPTQLWHNQERTLRYHPEGRDFVIPNGNRRFTRALYGTNTAFRVEAGDLPEFAMYMPGMGGNLKFGLIAGDQSKWLISAQKITARYRPGSMIYDIEDPILGSGKLHLVILALADAEGLVVKASFTGIKTVCNLVFAFGGASGKKFSRDGDMGPDPESSFYLKPENCIDNQYSIKDNSFKLKYGSGNPLQTEEERYENKQNLTTKTRAKKGIERTLIGIFPASAEMKLVDAAKQESPVALFSSVKTATPAIAGKLKIENNKNFYFIIQNPETKANLVYADAAKKFAEAEAARAKLANRVKINTPDPYINTVGGALAMASNAIWESPSYLHGAVGWRIRLNGWRGAYTADPLGWHDRAREHFRAYAKSQLTEPASGSSVPDSTFHFARQKEKLGTSVFTSGYISRDPNGEKLRPHHYDMNLVYMDELLRHFNWTGDLDFAREMWPVIQRHLAWEKRNFDPDDDGLYDAYAAIWASDALEYAGGSVTHTSAYSYRANNMAAEIAALIGENTKSYQQEAAKILKAINTTLWMPEKGWYAEFKDKMGMQRLHPPAALWSVYHTLDSNVPDAFQAYQSLRYVDTQIPHIPVKAKGLADGFYTIATSNWMPYEWSINNVVMAESLHTSLANWEAGRTDEAFKLWKSELLSSMYLGGSPGNFVQISYYDANRGEAYRDFGDPIGIASRTLVEGLFGIVPDALHNTLNIRPGLPSAWNYASIKIPDLSFDFKRKGQKDIYTLIPTFQKQLKLKFQVKAQAENIRSISVNGKKVNWKNVDFVIGQPEIEINSEAAPKYVIEINWKGAKPDQINLKKVYVKEAVISVTFPKATIVQVFDPQQTLTKRQPNGHTFKAKIAGENGNKTVFVQLKQGQVYWWYPLCFEVKDAVDVISRQVQASDGLKFRIQNNTDASFTGKILVNGFSKTITIPSNAVSDEIVVPADQVVFGTNPIQILGNKRSINTNLINWNLKNPSQQKTEKIDLSKYFNDQVTQIFKNKYLSPRPTTPTLQLPWQGIGEWTHPLDSANIDDTGLRKLAGTQNEIKLPQGISFQTPGATGQNNILFTSRWDNYLKETAIPLTGKASHAYFLMAGSTNPMQSQLENGRIEIEYQDGTLDSLLLKNPETCWPIEKDYYTDGFAFKLNQPRPIRIHLKTGKIVSGEESLASFNGKVIDGGAATVLDLPLNTTKTLKKLTLKTVANDVVIGLMSVTLVRE
jgi:hypothetical protein